MLKSLELFEIENENTRFVFRKKKGKQTKVQHVQTVSANKNPFLTDEQLIQFNTQIRFYFSCFETIAIDNEPTFLQSVAQIGVVQPSLETLVSEKKRGRQPKNKPALTNDF